MALTRGLLKAYSDEQNIRSLHRARLNAQKAARIEAEKAVAVKARFISLMSHQLRTPLNSIIGFAELLAGADRLDRDQVVQFARFIRDSGTTLLDTLNDIIEASRLAGGAVRLTTDEVDLREMVDCCFRDLAGDAAAANVRLKVDISEEARRVCLDQVRFGRVLANLVMNGIRYNRPGGTVTVSARPADSGTLAISISDTGLGMDPDELDRAMAPFGRVDPSYRSANAGDGLGLTLAKGIVELHGGRLTITSAKDSGTTVRIVLPAQLLVAPVISEVAA